MEDDQSNISLWETAKCVLKKNPNKYDRCISSYETLQAIKEVITSNKQLDSRLLRGLWIQTNKQTSMLWKEVMQKISDVDENEMVKGRTGIWANERKQAIKELSEKGYYVMKEKIPSAIIQAINKKLSVKAKTKQPYATIP